MPLAIVEEPYLSDETLLLALCIWRESRGCSLPAKIGVAHVIRNRCAMAPREGFKPTIKGNVLKPWAFSSFMQGDPNSLLYPAVADRSWKECLAAANNQEPDTTGGSVFYYSRPLTAPPKAWGNVGHTVDLDGLHFYKLDSV